MACFIMAPNVPIDTRMLSDIYLFISGISVLLIVNMHYFVTIVTLLPIFWFFSSIFILKQKELIPFVSLGLVTQKYHKVLYRSTDYNTVRIRDGGSDYFHVFPAVKCCPVLYQKNAKVVFPFPPLTASCSPPASLSHCNLVCIILSVRG